jgi:hypothetical protein
MNQTRIQVFVFGKGVGERKKKVEVRSLPISSSSAQARNILDHLLIYTAFLNTFNTLKKSFVVSL